MKFKIGQKVKVINTTHQPNDSTRKMIGKICEIKKLYPYYEYIGVYTPDKSDYWLFNESDLEAAPEEKTWDTLQVNDVLIYNDCDERTVLGVCGRVIFYSSFLDKDTTHSFDTKETLIKWGWKIKQDTPTEEVVEMTVEEAIKKLGELLGKEVKIK